jgi:rhodanese-related sulfurtransferase
MKFKNIIAVSIALVIAVFLAFTEVHIRKNSEIKPEQLFLDMIESTRYYTVEEVAHLIISQDPSLQLIDVRDPKYFNKFTLKNAMNIPLKDFLKEENIAYLDQDVYNTVLFSNGNSDADVAWMLATRLGYDNVFVMKGGLNQWVNNILQPKEHSVIWDRVSDQLYQYRMGASQYFGGSAPENSPAESTSKPKKVIKRRKKKEVEGGCG